MNAQRKKALARYIRGLDVLSLSQYMDLTAAVPAADCFTRLPSAEEISRRWCSTKRTSGRIS